MKATEYTSRVMGVLNGKGDTLERIRLKVQSADYILNKNIYDAVEFYKSPILANCVPQLSISWHNLNSVAKDEGGSELRVRTMHYEDDHARILKNHTPYTGYAWAAKKIKIVIKALTAFREQQGIKNQNLDHVIDLSLPLAMSHLLDTIEYLFNNPNTYDSQQMLEVLISYRQAFNTTKGNL